MAATIGVITFPGTLDDVDAARAARTAGAEVKSLWHADTDLHGVDAVVVPGGFSYGDYLRSGAISALAPVMQSVIDRAKQGMPVLGICNGFQILTEAGLLPGALTRNKGLHFHCTDTYLEVANSTTAWTSELEQGQKILVPAKHGEGRVVFRYTDNYNGSVNGIAGVSDESGRIVGLMPHPEHAIDTLTGPSTDGLGLFVSAIKAVAQAPAV